VDDDYDAVVAFVDRHPMVAVLHVANCQMELLALFVMNSIHHRYYRQPND
jgi:hypothetical protein